jgi:hypothetical protein
MDFHAEPPGPPDLIACPEASCLAPAQVVDRFSLWSTDGPVDHAKTMCLSGHGFTPMVDMLAAWPVAAPTRALGTGG